MTNQPIIQVRQWLAVALLLAACNSPDRVSAVVPGLTGDDGSVTVSSLDTVLNEYTDLAADATAGATLLTVSDAVELDSVGFGPLATGDLLLVVQMQGAVIDTSDTATYGTVTDLGGAGNYEFVRVASVMGNDISLDTTCPLRNNYSSAGNTQVIRVPELTTLTVEAGGSLTAPPWDGRVGGVVAVHVQGTATIDGLVDADAIGFRGGAVDNSSSPTANDITLFVSSAAGDGAEKGESIAGDSAVYDGLGGRYGRGAPANGGGGGNGHNAGGGGGANGDNSNAWSGQGVMDESILGGAAWMLDPAYIANGNAATDSSGGGRGGYTYGSSNQDALAVPPGDNAWGGNRRQEVGGWGGRPLANDPATRLFLGGGGGAGDGNNNGGGAGGIGGGLVLLIADTVTGTGQISANGGAGEQTSAGHNDAPGGGGGGGAAMVEAATLNGSDIQAVTCGNGGTHPR